MPPSPPAFLPPDAEMVAWVGVAKNVGKTTTLNWCLQREFRRDQRLGLVSVGVDGESTDALLEIDKPDIILPRGHWMVTSDRAIERAGVRVEYVEPLGVTTPLGNLVVVRMLERGAVLLAGVRHRADLERAREALMRHGVDRVCVDGAYGRVMATGGGQVDGVFVSTGAVVAATVEGIVEGTAPLIEQFRLEGPETPWMGRLIEGAAERDRPLLGGPEMEPHSLEASSLLVGLEELAERWSSTVEAVAVPGLVSDRVVDALLAAGGTGETLLVPDASVLGMEADAWQRLSSAWNVRVLHPVDLYAVSLNPTGVQGRRVDGERLEEAFESRWPDVSFFNPRESHP